MTTLCILKLTFFPQVVVAGSLGQVALDQGTKLYRNGKYQEAVTLFQKATLTDPGLMKAWENLGWAYSRSGQINKALEIWETILKVQPDNRAVRKAVGFLFTEISQWRRAIPHLIRSLRSEPDQIPVRLRLGKAYQNVGQKRRAVVLFKQALKIQPDSREVLAHLIDSYEKSGRWDLTLSLLKKFLASYPGSLDDETREWTAVKLSNLFARRGDETYKQERFKISARAYKQGLSWKPGNITILQNLGWAQEKQGKYNEAIKAWLKIVDLGVTGLHLFHQIANAYYHSGQRDQAELWYQNASGLDPSNQNIQFRLFELALSKKNISQALTALHRTVNFNPADPAWLLSVTNRFIRNDRIDQGLDFFHRQLSISSNAQSTNRALGKLYARKGAVGNAEQATWNYEQAILMDAKNASAYRDLGWRYQRAGKTEESERIWKQYREKIPDQVEPYNLLARLYLNQGAYKKSLEALNKSLKIDPNQPGQKLMQAKALYWDKQYPQAMERVDRIVLQYPDHLAIQYFYGEVLMQHQDYSRGQGQWRKVLDMGSTSIRAKYYWIKSLYERGKCETAIGEAQKFLDQHLPYRPIIKLLIADASFRRDKEQALFWYEALLNNFKDHSGDWLELAKLYRDLNRFSQANATLDEAQKQFPADVEIQLAIADIKVREGKHEAALRVFRGIRAKHPDNRRAFLGIFRALKTLGRLDAAIQHLQSDRGVFLKGYEMDLEMGNLRVAMKDPNVAEKYYSRVANPMKAGKYVPVLLYHGLSDYPRNHNLWVQRFEHQLEALADAGYTTLTVAGLANILNEKLPFPEKPVLITFDDGRRDAFRLGDPVLEKYGMKATLFVPADKFYDNDPLFADWDELLGYARSGRWDLQTLQATYFKLGFIQDRTGYNLIETGDTGNSLLRRFTVPRDWDGEHLIRHLAETHPAHRARVALAKSQYWNGQYTDAGDNFSKIIRQKPWLEKKFQFNLANISYQGGNYQDSKKILEGIPDQESVLYPKIEELQEALAWKNRPRILGSTNFFRDSNDRTNHSESVKLYFPLEIPLELMLEGGILNMQEKGRTDIDGGQVSAGFHLGVLKSLHLEGKLRQRLLSHERNTENYFGSVKYQKNSHQIRINGSRRDIDTVRAIEDGIKVKTYSLGYQTRFAPALLGRAGVSYQDYDDGNTGFDFRASVRYQLPTLKNWKIGANIFYRDSEFESSAYYTPDRLLTGFALLQYNRRFSKQSEIRANLGFGGAKDKVNGVRWVTNGGFNFDYFLTKSLKAGVETSFSVVPGYDSVNLQAVIGYRF
jgi:tetratricopeptide (TPR) repeat protein